MFKSSNQFDRCLEKATSHLLLEPDWDATLQICDAIRQGDVLPKVALQGIRKKIVNDNPHVANYALQVLESVVKNCGTLTQQEIATKEFMEFMKEQAKARPDPVKGKVLELIQVWSHAFRNVPSYRAVTDMYHLMKAEDFKFPVLKESDAMFSAEKAPEWKEGECCHRCRVTFGMVTRKHHCRNCGQVFCGKCTSKSSIIPKFGIEKEVRVCDSCHEALVKPGSGSTAAAGKKSEDDLPSEYLNSTLAQQSQSGMEGVAPPARSEQELREEEELQLALALSQSEAEEAKKKERGSRSYSAYSTRNDTSSSTDSSTSSGPSFQPVIDTSDMDPELARYLNRNYWEKKKEKSEPVTVPSTTPSAPVAQTEPKYNSTATTKTQEVYQNGDNDSPDQFLSALRSSVEIFVNRMKSNSLRGRSIANDSSVQTLFLTINQMHPELTKHLQEQEDLRAKYEDLQDKLAQLKDAREALDALRTDHMEKRRREAEEAERQRQIQMAHKLEVMRQKKQEYLEYQRVLAQQRLAEQERELQQRLEQQKQMAHMRQMQQYGYPQPQMYGQQLGQPGAFSPGGSAESSPIHRYQQGGAAYTQPGGMAPAIVGQQGALPPQQGSLPPQQGALPPQSMGYQYQQPMSQGAQFQPVMGAQNQQYWPSQQPGYQSAPPSGYQYNQGAPAPQGAPGAYQGAPGQQSGMYAPPQPGQEQYQSFDMQGMNAALPQQGGPGPQSAPGMVAPGAPGMAPPGGPQQGYGYQAPYPGQGDPAQQGPDQLISFD